MRQTSQARRKTAAGDRSRSRRGEAPAQRFYGAVLSEAERILLEEASGLATLEEEIPLLRLKLREAVADHPENIPLFLNVLEMLVRALSAQYRVSKGAEGDLSESLLGVVKGLGGVLGLGEEEQGESHGPDAR